MSRNVFDTRTDGYARYWAANFVFQKLKGSDKYAYRLGYNLSVIKSNTTGVNTRAQDSNDFAAEYVVDDNDRRHVFSGVFYYYPLPKSEHYPDGVVAEWFANYPRGRCKAVWGRYGLERRQ